MGKKNKSYSSAEAHMMLDGVAARISTVAHVHHRLARMPDGVIAFGSHLHEICDGLTAAFSTVQQPVRIDYRCDECPVPTKYVQPLTLDRQRTDPQRVEICASRRRSVVALHIVRGPQ